MTTPSNPSKPLGFGVKLDFTAFRANGEDDAAFKLRQAVTRRHPPPWRVDHSPGLSTSLVDVNGKDIDGVKVWLDDACDDGNHERLENLRYIAERVNHTMAPAKPTRDGWPV